MYNGECREVSKTGNPAIKQLQQKLVFNFVFRLFTQWIASTFSSITDFKSVLVEDRLLLFSNRILHIFCDGLSPKLNSIHVNLVEICHTFMLNKTGYAFFGHSHISSNNSVVVICLHERAQHFLDTDQLQQLFKSLVVNGFWVINVYSYFKKGCPG